MTERAREVLAGILERMGVDVGVEAREDPERIFLEVKGPDSGLCIGKKGQTLDALQFLVGKIVHRGHEGPFLDEKQAGEGDRDSGAKPIVVDTEGYRQKHHDSLVELATRLAGDAVRTGQVVAVNPMSPPDRRIMHLTCAKIEGVTTRSEGEGAFRRLLIIPGPAGS